MALTLEDVDKIIDKAKPQLLRRLDFSTFLQAELRRVDVITESLQDELQVPNLTPHKRINVFLEGLKTGPVERFLTFCRTLHTEGQGHLLLIMGVDISKIEEQISAVYGYVEPKCPYQQLVRPGHVYQRLIFNVPDLALPDPLTDRHEQQTEQDQAKSELPGGLDPDKAPLTASRSLPVMRTSDELQQPQLPSRASRASLPPPDVCTRTTPNLIVCEKAMTVIDKFQKYTVLVAGTKAAKRCNLKTSTAYELIVLPEYLCLMEKNKPVLTWNYAHFPRYGCAKDNFTLEAGQKCSSGEGLFQFIIPNQGQQLLSDVQDQMRQMKRISVKDDPNKQLMRGSRVVPAKNDLPENLSTYNSHSEASIVLPSSIVLRQKSILIKAGLKMTDEGHPSTVELPLETMALGAQSNIQNRDTVHGCAMTLNVISDCKESMKAGLNSNRSIKKKPIPIPRNLSTPSLPERRLSSNSAIESHSHIELRRVASCGNYSLAKCNVPRSELQNLTPIYSEPSEHRELDADYSENKWIANRTQAEPECAVPHVYHSRCQEGRNDLPQNEPVYATCDVHHSRSEKDKQATAPREPHHDDVQRSFSA